MAVTSKRHPWGWDVLSVHSGYDGEPRTPEGTRVRDQCAEPFSVKVKGAMWVVASTGTYLVGLRVPPGKKAPPLARHAGVVDLTTTLLAKAHTATFPATVALLVKWINEQPSRGAREKQVMGFVDPTSGNPVWVSVDLLARAIAGRPDGAKCRLRPYANSGMVVIVGTGWRVVVMGIRDVPIDGPEPGSAYARGTLIRNSRVVSRGR